MSQTGPLEQAKKVLKEAAIRNQQELESFDLESDKGPLGCCIITQGNSTTSQSGVYRKDCDDAAGPNHLKHKFLPGEECP